MKKIALLLVSILCIGALTVNAQGIIVKAGYNYSSDTKVSVKDIQTGRSGWHAGVGFQTEPTHGFSFQPELVYKVNGLKFGDAGNLRLSQLELPLNVQWGPDLLVCRPFVFGGPFIGYRFKPSGDEKVAEAVSKTLQRFEWGVGAGLGINVWKLQIAGKYNWNFGTFADVKSVEQALSNFDDISGHISTFEICVGLKF